MNADDVLAVLEAGRRIDVILTEVQLAGSVDGFELARQIRENHPDIDVILTSGVTRAADKAGTFVTMGRLRSRTSRTRSFVVSTSSVNDAEEPLDLKL